MLYTSSMPLKTTTIVDQRERMRRARADRRPPLQRSLRLFHHWKTGRKRKEVRLIGWRKSGKRLAFPAFPQPLAAATNV